ncbi:alpha-amylase family glycosyl hydrolase [Catellatospora sichuanensis]|uniref:alpha-amylase family glycosyl hydrolase n=1 Tax=Catellatospora sichuanensis TaxID=1969805 RepID=UPI00118200B7|nr:alpha-amylase family glycosyl hydrolase [Catellatospora sichuanensis]
MIFLAAYPQSFSSSHQGSTPLGDLCTQLPSIVPPSVGLHLLPFYPSEGDWGFAPNDWFSVLPTYGTWDDIRSIALQRKVIVDGIYNHVGLGHPFAASFFSDPHHNNDAVYGFQVDSELSCPRSPRGGPVLRSFHIEEKRWQVWQTFSESAIDIRLDNPRVLEHIHRHLELLVGHNIWGLRLDAPAYYAKFIDQPHRHNPDAYRLSRMIADIALARGLAVTAQLDCDEHGVKYFPRSDYSAPIVDYAYSAYLVLALLTAETSSFAEHLENTWHLPSVVVRAPRTHDGILLRSKLLSDRAKKSLLEAVAGHGVDVRVIDNDAYEVNSSLPYLCSLGTDIAGMRARIELCVAVSAFIPGWCCLYLPFVMGDLPEYRAFGQSDPRSLNRQPILDTARSEYVESGAMSSMYKLLESLNRVRGYFNGVDALTGDFVEVPAPGLLLISRPHARLMLVANFDTSRAVSVERIVKGDLVVGRRAQGAEVLPLGFGIWRY